MGSSQPIPANFGTASEIADVINFVKFHVDRFRGFRFGGYPNFARFHRKTRSSLSTVNSAVVLARDEHETAMKEATRHESAISVSALKAEGFAYTKRNQTVLLLISNINTGIYRSALGSVR
jgi:hypothetical protein